MGLKRDALEMNEDAKRVGKRWKKGPLER